jgi:hypothetical protein
MAKVSMGLKPEPNSEMRMRAVFDILREHSMFLLATSLVEGKAENPRLPWKELLEMINEFGGIIQVPNFAVDDYTFRIVPVKRSGGTMVTEGLLIKRYDGAKGWPDDSVKKYVKEVGNELFVENMPQPAYTVRPGGGSPPTDSDGNLVLVDEKNCKAYDFWQATTVCDKDGRSCGAGFKGDRIIAAGGVSVYDLDGPGARIPGGPPEGGGRATGLPYLGGLLIPEDLMNGKNSVLQHALVFAIPRLQYNPNKSHFGEPNAVFPADSSESTAFTVNPLAFKAGERIRLKPCSEITVLVTKGEEKTKSQKLADFDPRYKGVRYFTDVEFGNDKQIRIAPITAIVLRALQEYGAYLGDGSGAFTFYAESWRTAPTYLTEKGVEDLIGPDFKKSECKQETAWEKIIGTLNDQLSWALFGLESVQPPVVRLPFAIGPVMESNDDVSFHANFEVVRTPSPRERVETRVNSRCSTH